MAEPNCESLSLSFAILSKRIQFTQFLDAMQVQRSNTATRVRKMCGPQLFNCDMADLLESETRRAKFRERIGYIAPEADAGPGRYDAFNVEVLHKDYSGQFDVKTVFLNPVLHWVRVTYLVLLRYHH